MSGVVHLVGAGPGDAGLLTLRGAELIKKADVLVYDHLAAPEILKLAPAACRLIYAGKEAGRHALSQAEINGLLVREARAGHRVVRLKGGDPYIFGRGGEEAQELARAGVPFQVTPGISSAVAAAAYAGIPLTHRDFNSQVVLLTGHERPDRADSAHDWAALAKMGSLVVVMGLANLAAICQALTAAGRDPATPAALIQWGATPRQRVATAALADLPAAAAGLGPPALLVVGEVVNLRPELNWFEKLPLFGRAVLITRSRERAGRLAAALAELGAEVWERPAIAIEPLDAAGRLDHAFQKLAAYRWLILTSPTGAEIFLKALLASGRDARALGPLKIAAIGPGTAEALAPFGLKADLTPAERTGEGLLAALKTAGLEPGAKILLARGREGRAILPEGLARAGAQVEELTLYATLNPVWADPLPRRPDLTILASSSAVRGLAANIPPMERRLFPAAVIGPVTARTALEMGFPVAAEARTASVEALVEAALNYFAHV